jgi:hypothetical protein
VLTRPWRARTQVLDPLLQPQLKFFPAAAPAAVSGTNSSCPAGEPQCNYLPGKFECCKAGEQCIPNVGCRC